MIDRKTTPIILAVGLVACLILRPASAADLPVVLKVAMEEAEEAFFDGDYEESLRRLEKAEDWVENPNNRGLLINSGIDYQLMECFIFCLRGQVGCAMGDQKEAFRDIRAAERRLKDRRTYYIKRGGNSSEMWLLEAFLSFVKGDASVPIPDFGMADDEFLNGPLAKQLESRSSPAPAIKHYEWAANILHRPYAQGGTGLAEYVYERLTIRLLVAMAKIITLKQGIPSHGEIREAESYLVRAEERASQNPFYSSFIAPNARWPRSYSDFMDEAKSKAKSTGAGDNASLTEERLLLIKRFYSHALHDWLNVQMVRAEVAAASESNEAQYGWEPQSAERSFKRLESLCQSQYKGNLDHPIYGQISLARGNCFLRLGIRNREDIVTRKQKGKPEDTVLTASMLSYLRDACYEAERLQTTLVKHDKRSDLHIKMLESTYLIELRGLSIMLEDKAILGDLLSDDDRDAAEVRCNEIQGLLGQLLKVEQ